MYDVKCTDQVRAFAPTEPLNHVYCRINETYGNPFSLADAVERRAQLAAKMGVPLKAFYIKRS